MVKIEVEFLCSWLVDDTPVEKCTNQEFLGYCLEVYRTDTEDDIWGVDTELDVCPYLKIKFKRIAKGGDK